jgi:hypothetical protein
MLHMEKQTVITVKYLRLGGNGPQGRWYFTADWAEKKWLIEHQPNSILHGRASVLREGAYREQLGAKIMAELSPELLDRLEAEIGQLTAVTALYPAVRRSSLRLRSGFAAWTAAIILQNCDPEVEHIAFMEKRCLSFLKAGLVRPPKKAGGPHYFGNSEVGFFWLHEVPKGLYEE